MTCIFSPQIVGRKRSISLTQPSPFKPGIPLGTITAQLASKSFWTGSMLEERLKQIAHTALQETHSISIAEVQEKAENSNENTKKAQKVDYREERELRTPSCSSQGEPTHGYRTPPFLSPGATRRIRWMEEFIL